MKKIFFAMLQMRILHTAIALSLAHTHTHTIFDLLLASQ